MAESSSSSSFMNKLQDLLSRVEALEIQRFSKAKWCGSSDNEDEDYEPIIVDEAMRRARYAVETTTNYQYSVQWRFVPKKYYSITLNERAKYLNAPSIHYLCKSLLLENRKVDISTTTTSTHDPTNPKYILVILQYASILDMKKLITAIRKLRTNVQNRLDENQFDIRIASESDNDRITGYTHNSVTPFGMKCYQPAKQDEEGQKMIEPPPMILLSSGIVPHQYFWLGGGHVHLKLGLSISDFCSAFPSTHIVDISRPRTAIDNDENNDGL